MDQATLMRLCGRAALRYAFLGGEDPNVERAANAAALVVANEAFCSFCGEHMEPHPAGQCKECRDLPTPEDFDDVCDLAALARVDDLTAPRQ